MAVLCADLATVVDDPSAFRISDIGKKVVQFGCAHTGQHKRAFKKADSFGFALLRGFRVQEKAQKSRRTLRSMSGVLESDKVNRIYLASPPLLSAADTSAGRHRAAMPHLDP